MSTVNKQRQLNLDELRRLKWLLGGAMALVSLWTVFFLDIEALGLVGVVSAVVFAALVWPQFPARVPAVIWRLSVPAIIVVAGLDLYFSPDTLPVLIRLAVLLVFYRSVSYRRKREDLQLIVLGMFLIVVAGVLTVSLGFAFLLLLFTAFALGFLFVINLVDAAETGGPAAVEGATAWTRIENGKFLTRLRGVADWRLMGFSAVLFTAVVVMSGLLFLIIPRFELSTGFLFDRYITRKSRTGFTENVKFGDVTELVRDESVAMRVDLTDLAGLSERPYWRMVVLDEYTPQGLRMSPELRAELIRSQFTMQHVPGRVANRLNVVGGTWTFYIEPGVSRFFPMPGSFSMIHLRDLARVQWSQEMRLLALPSEPVAMSAFRMEGVEQTRSVRDSSFARALADARAHAGDKPDTQKYNPLIMLKAPSGAANQAVLERIVAEINGGMTLSADEFSRRATAWLQVHHAYAMSVKLPAAADQDEIVRWLNSSEPGFCEYFASGFIALARTAGYPARLVTGFRGGVLNAFENYYMVRNSDAHAWAEIYDGSTAWLRVDPTPGGSVATLESATAQMGKQEHDSSWSARLDSLRVLWYRRVINFDSRTQVQMLEQVKNVTRDYSGILKERFQQVSKWLKSWLGRPWSMARLAKTAGLIAGAAALIWSVGLMIRWGWARSRRWLRPQEFDPVRREAGRRLARLRAAGEMRSRESEGGDDELNLVVADLRRLRYGKRETWPEPKSVFRKAKRAQRRRS